MNDCLSTDVAKQMKKLSNESYKVATKRAAFVAPSLEEVSIFFQSIGGTTAESEMFCDHFTANGWKVGKNPMKDWRAAARNWHRRNPDFDTRRNIPSPELRGAPSRAVADGGYIMAD